MKHHTFQTKFQKKSTPFPSYVYSKHHFCLDAGQGSQQQVHLLPALTACWAKAAGSVALGQWAHHHYRNLLACLLPSPWEPTQKSKPATTNLFILNELLRRTRTKKFFGYLFQRERERERVQNHNAETVPTRAIICCNKSRQQTVRKHSQPLSQKFKGHEIRIIPFHFHSFTKCQDKKIIMHKTIA